MALIFILFQVPAFGGAGSPARNWAGVATIAIPGPMMPAVSIVFWWNAIEQGSLGKMTIPLTDSVMGLEYDVIGIEEATTLSSRKHQSISTCCRTSKQNWRPQIGGG
jgi:hypothetical protein